MIAVTGISMLGHFIAFPKDERIEYYLYCFYKNIPKEIKINFEIYPIYHWFKDKNEIEKFIKAQHETVIEETKDLIILNKFIKIAEDIYREDKKLSKKVIFNAMCKQFKKI